MAATLQRVFAGVAELRARSRFTSALNPRKMEGMSLAAQILAGLVALLHVYFLVLEMFLWKKPYGRRVFGTTPEQAEATAVLAGNQGLYNGFLAAGLIWSLVAAPALMMPLRIFFLGCVIVAGVYGAASVNKRILFVQALPAAAALVCAFLAAS